MNFREAITEFGRQISVKITYDNITLEKEGVKTCNKSFKGDLFKSIMQYIDVELNGLIDLKDKELKIEFGVLIDEKYEYINWGTFIVDNESIEKSIETNSTKLTAYDYLYKSHILYDLQIAYPITVKKYIKEICKKLGYSFVTDNFVNMEKIIEEEKYLGSYEKTYRDVLDELSGVVGGVICIKGNCLYIKYPTNTDCVLNENNLKSMHLSKRFGPINSLVLSLQPQEDNLYRYDEVSIAENGKTEIKISNNELMNKKREDFIDDLFNKLNGLYFYPFEIESFGFGYFDPYDTVTIIDLEGKEYKTLILSDSCNIGTGFVENTSCTIPDSSKTDYSKATQDEKLLYETILTVDKQNKVIEAVVKQEGENTEQINKLRIDVDGIDLEVSKTANSIYKFETGSGNIFENCYQYIEKDSHILEEITSSDMPLGINKEYLRGKDIVISVDVNVLNGIIGSLESYCGAGFNVKYKDGTYQFFNIRFYVGQITLSYILSQGTIDFDKRIYAHYKLDDKEIESISNLKIIANMNADKIVVSYPKVEFGTFPTGFDFDVAYVRDNVETIQKDYTLIKQEVSSLSLQAVSMETEITTIKGDVTEVEKRLQSTELKLTPTEITAMVNEKIGADGKLTTVKVTIDKNGLDVKNGAISITNNNGTKVLYADTNGDLVGNKITINNLQSMSGKIGKFNIDDKGFNYTEAVNIDGKACTFTLDIHPNAKESFMNWKLQTNDQSADDIAGALTYSGLVCNGVSALFIDGDSINVNSINSSNAYIDYLTSNELVTGDVFYKEYDTGNVESLAVTIYAIERFIGLRD